MKWTWIQAILLPCWTVPVSIKIDDSTQKNQVFLKSFEYKCNGPRYLIWHIL